MKILNLKIRYDSRIKENILFKPNLKPNFWFQWLFGLFFFTFHKLMKSSLRMLTWWSENMFLANNANTQNTVLQVCQKIAPLFHLGRQDSGQIYKWSLAPEIPLCNTLLPFSKFVPLSCTFLWVKILWNNRFWRGHILLPVSYMPTNRNRELCLERWRKTLLQQRLLFQPYLS